MPPHILVLLAESDDPSIPTTKQKDIRSKLFNLTAAIAFGQDRIASNPETDEDGELNGTREWLKQHLPRIKFSAFPNRKHLAPLGFRDGDSEIAERVIQLLRVETQVLENSLLPPLDSERVMEKSTTP